MTRVTRLVAGREIAEFLRERSMLTATVGPIVVVAILIVFLQVLGIGKSQFRVAVAGTAAQQVARAAQTYAILNSRTIVVVHAADDAAVRRAVAGGSADAGIVRDGGEIVAGRRLDRRLALSLQSGAHAVRAGVQPPPPLPINQRSDSRTLTIAAAWLGMSLIYMQLLRFGFGLAARVVEERGSRLIEVLLVATAVAVVWFVLGYVLFGAMYVVAAVMSGDRPLQSAVFPLTSVMLLSYVLTLFAVTDADGPLAGVLSLVPFTAPMNAPGRVLAADMPADELVLSFALLVAGAAVALAVALRIYAGAAASVDPRPRLRDAWLRAN
ncbi:MAG TPA: hypothetical protein VNT54_18445 [Solirubrobacteraceae bacterium]|nr:hypothetical protein [Solirubrobacteraceae bacterium]